MQTVDKELSKYTLDAIKALEELDYRIDIITKSSSISPKMVPMVEGDNLIRSLFRIGELRESILDKVILLKLVEEEEVLSYVGDLLSSEFKESILHIRNQTYFTRVLNNVSLTQEMVDWYSERTNLHIKLVQKYLKKIQALHLPDIDSTLLTTEMDHDTGKWVFPEYEPYVHINWKYRQLRHGIDYQVPDEVNETDATFHHVKNHRHHPEYWDDEATVDSINPKNRDKPSGKQVDATRMPLTYVASMMADWLAMSEEKSTDVHDWIKMNVNIRWKFSLEQITLMYVIVRDIPVERKSTIEQLEKVK